MITPCTLSALFPTVSFDFHSKLKKKSFDYPIQSRFEQISHAVSHSIVPSNSLSHVSAKKYKFEKIKE